MPNSLSYGGLLNTLVFDTPFVVGTVSLFKLVFGQVRLAK